MLQISTLFGTSFPLVKTAQKVRDLGKKLFRILSPIFH
jgi:hypothetical protein